MAGIRHRPRGVRAISSMSGARGGASVDDFGRSGIATAWQCYLAKVKRKTYRHPASSDACQFARKCHHCRIRTRPHNPHYGSPVIAVVRPCAVQPECAAVDGMIFGGPKGQSGDRNHRRRADETKEIALTPCAFYPARRSGAALAMTFPQTVRGRRNLPRQTYWRPQPCVRTFLPRCC